MQKFNEWLNIRINEAEGDIRQVKVLKLDPQGFMHFQNHWDGQQGTSSRIVGAKPVSDMGDGIILLQISTESGTRYMAKVDKMMANKINQMGLANKSAAERTRNPAMSRKPARLGNVEDHPLYGKDPSATEPEAKVSPVMSRRPARLGNVQDHPLYGK